MAITTFASHALFLSICLLLLAGAVLILYVPNGPAKWLLLLLSLFGVYGQALSYLALTGGLESRPYLLRSAYPFELGAIPLAFLYVCSLTDSKFHLSRIKPVHLIPFLIGLAWYFAVLIFGSPSLFEFSEGLALDKRLRSIVALCLAVFYLWNARKKVEGLENGEHRAEIVVPRLAWLKFLMFLWYFVMASYFLDSFWSKPIFWVFRGFATTVALLGLIFFALRYSRFLSWDFRTATSYRLSQAEVERLRNEALRVIKSENLYLNPRLRLEDVAEKMGIKPYRLSEALNRGANGSFFEFINSMRAEHAKNLLVDPKFSHFNLVGIALESGFNSKSVFNRCFKEYVGQTPSEYRKKTS